MRAYRQQNRERIAEINRRYQRTPKAREAQRNARLRRRYGIGAPEYDELLAQQGGCCAVCRDSFDYPLRVDHDHETGAVRGLLCINCNTALGHLKDDPTRARAVIDYLEGHARVQVAAGGR